MSHYCVGCGKRLPQPDIFGGHCRACRAAIVEAPTLRARVAELEAQLATATEQGPPAVAPGVVHPETICRCCGGANCVWHAPNALWNAVLGTADNPRAEGVILCPTCFTASVDAHLTALRARVAELEAKLEESKRPHLCGVCVGKPLVSGRQCICGGVGTEAAEMQGLRAECSRLTDEVARLTTARADMQERYAKACESFAEITRTPEGAIGAIGAYACAIIIRSLSPTPEPPHA